MADPRQAVIDKIRKLLAMSEGRGATEAEAATALAMARRLLDRHRIDMAEIAAGPASDGWVDEAAFESSGVLRVPPEVRSIAPLLTIHFGVKAYTTQEGPPDFRVSLRIFGSPVEVEVARWVFVYLSGVFQDLWTAHRVKTRCRKDRQGAYYAGLASSLHDRLKAGRAAEVREAGPSGANALVPLREALDRAFDEAHPEMPSRKPTRYRDAATCRAGAADGERINLSRPVAGQQARALPGGGSHG